jgi:hypothetical protein
MTELGGGEIPQSDQSKEQPTQPRDKFGGAKDLAARIRSAIKDRHRDRTQRPITVLGGVLGDPSSQVNQDQTTNRDVTIDVNPSSTLSTSEEKLGEEVPHGAVVDAILESTSDDETTPSWFKDTAKTIADAWFDPKSFEKDPTLYEKLGIRTFKRYLPTGDLIPRLLRRRFTFIGGTSVNDLKNYERFTRVYETIHLGFLGLGAAALGEELASGKIGQAAFTAGINTLVNVYPIMLQRYNRSRLYRTINRIEEREARKAGAESSHQQPPTTDTPQ